MDCNELQTVEFGILSQLKTIGEQAFYNCAKLSNIILPNGVAELGYCAFASCAKLTNINIPSSVEAIGGYTFHLCNNLKTMYIDSSIFSNTFSVLENVAIYNLYSLENIYILATISDENVGTYIKANFTKSNSTTTHNSKTYYKWYK